jgi:hypothetical protein
MSRARDSREGAIDKVDARTRPLPTVHAEMKSNRSCFYMLLLAFSIIAAGGCETDESHGGAVPGECGQPVPIVQLLYPIPGSTNVPTEAGVLVYEGTYAGTALAHSTSPASVPIELVSGSAAPIDAQPTAVPQPIPSPAATPRPYNVGSAYAVALETLSPNTTYQVLATQTGCFGQLVRTNIGIFTTL